MKSISRCAIIFLALATSLSAADRRYAFQQTQLDNGMKVITLEDFSCPIVAVQVWYHVGAVNEDPKRQGFAHMFEHMMFRGTDRLSETAHFDNIRRVGGDNNAYTSFDQTVYIQEVPSNQLELVLWLESERMAFLKIDQKGFDTERKVVEEELRMGHNRPYGRVPEKLLADIYGDIPYGWTPGGQISHLRSSTIDELQTFWDKYYVPNNATLVIVGAVKHADAQRLAKKYFEWIPRCPDVAKVTLEPVAAKDSRTVTLPEDKGPLPILGVVYRTVPDSHPDATALGVLMGVLGGGESSRLYVDVVKDQKIAQMAIATAFGLEHDGLAGAGGVLLPFGKKKELMQTIKRHIKKITEEPISASELEKQKNQLRRGEVMGALTVANKARLLGTYAVLYGDAERINHRLEEIDAVTAADVLRVAKKYLTNDHRISVSIEPSAAGVVGNLLGGKKDADSEGPQPTSQPDRVATRTGPKAKAVRPSDFPAKPPIAKLLEEYPETPHTDRTLPNGLRVVVVSNHEVPMVSMMLGFKSGGWTEPKPGVASMAMDMLTKGTKTRDAKKLAEILESNAISLGGSAGMDTARVSASALLRQWDLATELLADVVRSPTFPKDEFDILLKQARMGLMVSTKTPEYLAERELRRRLYGDHPYARTSSGELEDLDNITIDAMKAWWAENLRPDNSVMYVAGDIEASDAFNIIDKHLGGWKVAAPKAKTTLAEIPAAQPTHIYLVDRPGSVQSQIRMGQIGIVRRDPRYFVSLVMGNIFGGGFNSRLNKAVRVEKGLTYGARGGFSARRFSGELRLSTFTKTPTTADTVRTLLTEVDKIRSAPPGSEELSDTKTYLTGSFPGERETPEATVGDLWLIETEGLPGDYLQRWLKGVKSAGADDVLQAAQTLIDPKKLTIVVVGEADKIKESLEKIAPVTVVNAPTTTPEKEKPEPGEKAG